MAKRGGTRHLKRMAAPKTIPIHGRKEAVWLLRGTPGPHSAIGSMPLGVLLRDVLGVAKSMSEAKKLLSQRMVLVDAAARVEPKFPVGFMDIVDLPKAGKSYRIMVDIQGRLRPHELGSAPKNEKLAKVVKKFTVSNGKTAITLHDGKTLLSDSSVRVGDSVRIELPTPKVKQVIALAPGVHCLVREGKHAGTLATLEEIIKRKEGKADEARLRHGNEEFITVAKYLFAVDDKFKP